MLLSHGPKSGSVILPPSKSHLHRLLVADFLSGAIERLVDSTDDSDDILATKRCLRALSGDTVSPELDCGESGTTLRFLRPVAAALGKKPRFVTHGRLASRPDIAYDAIRSGLHELPGDVSSQFASGLLFALPILRGDSEIRFTSRVESAGYIDLTVSVVQRYGIDVVRTATGFFIPGGQRYLRTADIKPEADWSAAAVWLAMNALGSNIKVNGLDCDSLQPDRVIADLLRGDLGAIDVSQCPDLFPVLAVVAARRGTCRFTGTRRLHYKESDRIGSVAGMLSALGIPSEEDADGFVVHGGNRPFDGGEISTFGDHRIAMAAALAATASTSDVTIDDWECVSKSYPDFFTQYDSLRSSGVA